MARVRIEYVRPRHGGDAYGISADVVQEIARTTDDAVVPAEVLTVGPAQLLSSAAPLFVTTGGFAGGVFARIRSLQGAVVVSSASEDPAVTETTGLRLEAGDKPLLVSVQTGYRFAFREAVAAPRIGGRISVLSNAVGTGPVVENVPGAAYIWSAVGTFNGATLTLRELQDDGATWLDLETLTAPGRKGVVVGEGRSVRVIVSGGTGPLGLYSGLA